MIKNIFITGLPGCGKTTLIKEILRELHLNAGGFYTSEIRENNIRKGFKITSLVGRGGILAHVDIKSPYKVSRYKVNIKDLEEIGVKSILDALKENKIVIIDETGKAEMFSNKFRQVVSNTLNSKNKILGTIKLTHDPFTDKIKKRKDTKVFYLTRDYNPPTTLPLAKGEWAPNFQEIKEKIKNLLR